MVGVGGGGSTRRRQPVSIIPVVQTAQYPFVIAVFVRKLSNGPRRNAALRPGVRAGPRRVAIAIPAVDAAIPSRRAPGVF